MTTSILDFLTKAPSFFYLTTEKRYYSVNIFILDVFYKDVVRTDGSNDIIGRVVHFFDYLRHRCYADLS